MRTGIEPSIQGALGRAEFRKPPRSDHLAEPRTRADSLDSPSGTVCDQDTVHNRFRCSSVLKNCKREDTPETHRGGGLRDSFFPMPTQVSPGTGAEQVSETHSRSHRPKRV